MASPRIDEIKAHFPKLMADNDWQKVREIFDSALLCSPDQRRNFVVRACNGNEPLLAEIESLFASLDSSESFLETPAVAGAEDPVGGNAPGLDAGYCLGHYKIIEQLGSGGMGEVYLAHDQKLDRLVAVKILNDKFSDDASNLARFRREAKAASALNHPNILIIHEIGEAGGAHYIVSEFIKGKTLRELLRERALPLSEVLDLSVQIAQALAAAHEAHLIHRDIKPENIMLRPDGYLKILDFGLAKLVGGKNRSFLDLEKPASIQHRTAKGMIMGTVNYMSPEQAKGEDVDERSDIFSLGIVVYEMIAGRTPFAGDSMSETFANLINAEPLPLARFSSDLPYEIESIVAKMLRKNAGERFQTMQALLSDLMALRESLQRGDVSKRPDPPRGQSTLALNKTTGHNAAAFQASTLGRPDVRTIENPVDIDSTPVASPRPRVSKPALIAASVLLTVLAGLGVSWKIISQRRNQAPSIERESLRMTALVSWDIEAGDGDAGARFSPQGTMIAYSETKDSKRNIWTKQIPDGKPTRITDGDQGYHNPIWSHDGQSIAFVSGRDDHRTIWSMPFTGGLLTPLKELETGANLLYWSRDRSTIYYRVRFNVFTLDISSGQVRQLTNFDSTDHAQFFSISPGEDRIAYSSGPNERLHIFVMPLGGGPPVQVTDGEASDEYPFWLPDGQRIIYSSKRDGVFQPRIASLDEGRTEPIDLDISDTLIGDVAADGSRILFQQFKEESDLWQLRIGDKSETRITSDPGLELWSDASPDGRHIVFQATTESKHLLEGSIRVRSIDDDQQLNIASNGFDPTFSPDGRHVAFLRHAGNLVNLWITGTSGGNERGVTTDGIGFPSYTEMPYNRLQVRDYSWSPDGNSLIYVARNNGFWNIWRAGFDGATAPQAITNNTDPDIRFACPLYATDGKGIAYLASGTKPSSGGATTAFIMQIGEEPNLLFSSASVFKLIGWAPDGKRLIIAVPETQSTEKPSTVRLRFVSGENNAKDLAMIDSAYYHDVQLSPDGSRIAIATRESGMDAIRVILTTGGENASIATTIDPAVHVSSIGWSPDSRSVYYSKQKKVGSIAMIDNFK